MKGSFLKDMDYLLNEHVFQKELEIHIFIFLEKQQNLDLSIYLLLIDMSLCYLSLAITLSSIINCGYISKFDTLHPLIKP
jgi:hypothetical protein